MGKLGDLENSELHSKSKGFKSLNAVQSKPTKEAEEIAYEMRRAGATLQEIGTTFEISLWSVQELIKSAFADDPYVSIEALGKFVSTFNARNEYWRLQLIHKADDRVTTAASSGLKPKKGVARTLQDHPSKTNDGGRDE